MLFGGSHTLSCNMYAFSEEGECKRVILRNAKMPGGMNQGAVLVSRSEIYAVGSKQVGNEWSLQIDVFNGKKWKSIV